MPCSVLQISSVPCWEFIGWIGHMLPLLDKEEAVAIQRTVEDIADHESPGLRGLVCSCSVLSVPVRLLNSCSPFRTQLKCFVREASIDFHLASTALCWYSY